MPTLIPVSVATEIFNAAVGVGVNGTAFAMPARASLVAWQIFFGTPPASITVNLQASNDGVTFTTIDTTVSIVNGSMRFTFSSARFVRVNVSAVSGGDTLSVLVSCAPANFQDILGAENAVLATQSAQIATTAVITEEDLFSYTVPARSLVTNGRSLRVRVWGKTAANGNTKTVRIKFGADTFVVFSGAVNNLDWYGESLLMRRGFSSQIRKGNTLLSGVLPVTSVVTAGLDETSSIAVKVTGENGSASAGDITCEGVIFDSIPGIAGLAL